jgi:hypothetical protein
MNMETNNDALPEIHIAPGRRGAFNLIFACVGFVVVSVYMIVDDRELFHRIVGVMGVLLFGGGLVVLAWSLLRKGPVLVLDAEGFTDSAALGHPLRVRWEEVSGFSLALIAKQQMLVVHLADPDALIARCTGLRRWNLRTSLRWYGAPVYLAARHYDRDLEELEKLMFQYWQGRDNVLIG